MTDMPEMIWAKVETAGDQKKRLVVSFAGNPLIQTKYRRADLPPKVKPLVWFEVEKSRYGGKYTADGYTIRYIEGLWLLDFAGASRYVWRFTDIEAAQAAAQADYTARIIAALVTP